MNIEARMIFKTRLKRILSYLPCKANILDKNSLMPYIDLGQGLEIFRSVQ